MLTPLNYFFHFFPEAPALAVVVCADCGCVCADCGCVCADAKLFFSTPECGVPVDPLVPVYKSLLLSHLKILPRWPRGQGKAIRECLWSRKGEKEPGRKLTAENLSSLVSLPALL